MIRKTFLLTLLLLLALPFGGWAQTTEWTADNIDVVYLRDRTQYVCDPDGLLSDSARAVSNAALRTLEDSTSVQTVFIVVRHVRGGDAFRMAQDVGNKYGVGSKERRDGLIIVISVDDHDYFIAPGKGLESDLTDVECGRIGRACIVQNMRNDNLDAAVSTTCQAIARKLITGHTGLPAVDDDAGDEGGLWAALFLALIIFFIPFLWVLDWVLGFFIWLFSGCEGKIRDHRPMKDWWHIDNNHRGGRGGRRGGGGGPFIFGGGGGFGILPGSSPAFHLHCFLGLIPPHHHSIKPRV